MSSIRIGDAIIEDSSLFEQQVLDFYSSLDASNNFCMDNGLVEMAIPAIVTNNDNTMLTKLPSMEEVKAVVFDMNGSGAPVPDGFGGCFFQAHWDVVQLDDFQSVSQFFTQSLYY